MPKKHKEHKSLSIAAIKQGVLANPEHQSKEIVEYVEWQLNKGTKKKYKVTHLEKMKSEVVFGEEHVVWDVFTNESGRWWVITHPTNLYSQAEFPSLDYTLSFHIGVTANCNELCNTRTATRLVTLLMRKTATTWVTHSTLRTTRSRNENKGCSAEGSGTIAYARHSQNRNREAIEEVAALGIPLGHSL